MVFKLHFAPLELLVVVLEGVTTWVGCCFFLPGEAAAERARSNAVPREGLAPKAAATLAALLEAVVLLAVVGGENGLLVALPVAAPNGVVVVLVEPVATLVELWIKGAVFTPWNRSSFMKRSANHK